MLTYKKEPQKNQKEAEGEINTQDVERFSKQIIKDGNYSKKFDRLTYMEA